MGCRDLIRAHCFFTERWMRTSACSELLRSLGWSSGSWLAAWRQDLEDIFWDIPGIFHMMKATTLQWIHQDFWGKQNWWFSRDLPWFKTYFDMTVTSAWKHGTPKSIAWCSLKEVPFGGYTGIHHFGTFPNHWSQQRQGFHWPRCFHVYKQVTLFIGERIMIYNILGVPKIGDTTGTIIPQSGLKIYRAPSFSQVRRNKTIFHSLTNQNRDWNLKTMEQKHI